jgi:signal transduction histidine kinase
LALGDVPLVAEVDQARVYQVLLNLVANAAKFTPEGGRVVLSGRCEGAGVHLTVLDSGPGIPASDLKRIFESFVRLDRAAEGAASGTGLGLAICKKIVEAGHGGRIWAESPSGAALHVWLPATAR